MKYFKEVFKSKPSTYALVVILVGTILGVGGWWYFNRYYNKGGVNKDVLAIVGNKKIIQRDLNERICGITGKTDVENPGEVSEEMKKQLIEELIEDRIFEITAERLNITVSDKEIEEENQKENPNFSNFSEERKNLIKKSVRNRLLKKKVEESVVSVREGQYLNVRFDRHYPDVEGGTQEQIDADRKYAEDLANRLYQQLTNDEITFEKAIEIVNNDLHIDINSYPGYWGSQGGNFISSTTFLLDDDVKNVVDSLKVGEISEPFLRKVIVEIEEGEQEMKEGVFMIIKVANLVKKEADGFPKWLEEQKKILTIRRYY